MDIFFNRDTVGRLICTVESDGREALVTAVNGSAASADLLAALIDLEETGYGECFWQETVGEYRWIFRKSGERLIVVTLWSSGTVTGWQHVVHAETDLAAFVMRTRFELDGQPS